MHGLEQMEIESQLSNWLTQFTWKMVDKQVCVCVYSGRKKRHSLEPNKYPYVSPSKVNLKYKDDITDTARYPLVKAHGMCHEYDR